MATWLIVARRVEKHTPNLWARELTVPTARSRIADMADGWLAWRSLERCSPFARRASYAQTALTGRNHTIFAKANHRGWLANRLVRTVPDQIA